jgi:hypothetical protein
MSSPCAMNLTPTIRGQLPLHSDIPSTMEQSMLRLIDNIAALGILTLLAALCLLRQRHLLPNPLILETPTIPALRPITCPPSCRVSQCHSQWLPPASQTVHRVPAHAIKHRILTRTLIRREGRRDIVRGRQRRKSMGWIGGRSHEQVSKPAVAIRMPILLRQKPRTPHPHSSTPVVIPRRHLDISGIEIETETKTENGGRRGTGNGCDKRKNSYARGLLP